MTSNERRLKGYQPRVAEINALEKTLEGLPDETLRARTEQLKKQVAGRGIPGQSKSGKPAARPFDKDELE
jgi:preprotein translocase subunit SecA